MYDPHDLRQFDESRRGVDAYRGPSGRGMGLGGSVIAWAIIAAAVLGIIWFVTS